MTLSLKAGFIRRVGMKTRRPALALPMVLIVSLGAGPAKAAPDLGGVYWAESYSAKIAPTGGGEPPYTPQAMAAYKTNMADLAVGKRDDTARTLCLPDGVPRILATPYPFEIVDVPARGEIYLIYEMNHVIREVDMEKPLPPEKQLADLPFYSGHSFGHWDGDTLVIETAGFNDSTFLDNAGAPHTDQLRTVERIRKTDSGKALEDLVTIHDPGVFTKNWSERFVYRSRPGLRLTDWNCGEKHRDLSSVKDVHPQ
jgi:hypothetical protein